MVGWARDQEAHALCAGRRRSFFLDNVAGWILELDRGQGIPFEGAPSRRPPAGRLRPCGAESPAAPGHSAVRVSQPTRSAAALKAW